MQEPSQCGFLEPGPVEFTTIYTLTHSASHHDFCRTSPILSSQRGPDKIITMDSQQHRYAGLEAPKEGDIGPVSALSQIRSLGEIGMQPLG